MFSVPLCFNPQEQDMQHNELTHAITGAAMKPWLNVGLLSIACALIVGCSNHPDVALARGVVKMDGKALPGGRVMFQPIAVGEDKIVGKSAMGQIQEDGSFVLTTYEDGDGATVGSHQAVVMENRQDDDPNSDRPTRKGPRIGVVTLNDITFDVVAGEENVFTIELDSRSHAVRDALPEKGL